MRSSQSLQNDRFRRGHSGRHLCAGPTRKDSLQVWICLHAPSSTRSVRGDAKAPDCQSLYVPSFACVSVLRPVDLTSSPRRRGAFMQRVSRRVRACAVVAVAGVSARGATARRSRSRCRPRHRRSWGRRRSPPAPRQLAAGGAAGEQAAAEEGALERAVAVHAAAAEARAPRPPRRGPGTARRPRAGTRPSRSVCRPPRVLRVRMWSLTAISGPASGSSSLCGAATRVMRSAR